MRPEEAFVQGEASSTPETTVVEAMTGSVGDEQ